MRLTCLNRSLASVALVVAMLVVPRGGPSPARAAVAGAIPAYQHIYLVMLENHGYSQIIGRAYAPRINRLARTYGLATNYYGVTHPSEPNYLATIGGSNFGLYDDWSYTVNVKGDYHTLYKPSLASQLEGRGLTWKTYQESLPYAGYMGEFYPNGTEPLYAVKHNPFLFFANIQKNKIERQRIVPLTQLTADLRAGRTPNFSYIVPNQCDDMHGTTGTCPYAVKPLDVHDLALIARSDAFVGTLVDRIMGAPGWSRGHNAIVLVWDEDDSSTSSTTMGCCDSPRGDGGGHVAAIVITNTGRHGTQDATPYNHYSLLRSFQIAFGLGCLEYTCDGAHVKPMTPLFGT